MRSGEIAGSLNHALESESWSAFWSQNRIHFCGPRSKRPLFRGRQQGVEQARQQIRRHGCHARRDGDVGGVSGERAPGCNRARPSRGDLETAHPDRPGGQGAGRRVTNIGARVFLAQPFPEAAQFRPLQEALARLRIALRLDLRARVRLTGSRPSRCPWGLKGARRIAAVTASASAGIPYAPRRRPESAEPHGGH